MSKMILSDFQRGRLPYFVAPPSSDAQEYIKQSETVAKKIVPTDNEVSEESVRLQTIKQNFKPLEMTTEFNAEDQTRESEDDDDNDDNDEVLKNADESDDNEECSDNENTLQMETTVTSVHENHQNKRRNFIQLPSEDINEELNDPRKHWPTREESYDYFDRAKRKASIKHTRVEDEHSSFSEDDCIHNVSGVENSITPRECPSANSGDKSEDLLTSDFADSLTAEERSFLGLPLADAAEGGE